MVSALRHSLVLGTSAAVPGPDLLPVTSGSFRLSQGQGPDAPGDPGVRFAGLA
jgi:hypothetical protein